MKLLVYITVSILKKRRQYFLTEAVKHEVSNGLTPHTGTDFKQKLLINTEITKEKFEEHDM